MCSSILIQYQYQDIEAAAIRRREMMDEQGS